MSGSSSASSAWKSPPRGREEGVDHGALARVIGVGHRGRALHPAAGAAGELPRRGRGAPHDGSDLLEGHGEHVVQHERDPLAGGQRVQDHEQRGTDRIGQHCFVLGIGPLPATHERLGPVRAQGLLAP